MGYRLLKETTPIARKQHVCVWCGEAIPVGSKHVYERSIYDGDFQNHRWHDECLEAMRELASMEGGVTEFEPKQNPRGGLPTS